MDVDRKGRFMNTYTGGRFYPLDPQPEDLRILDIARALSQLCRFAGHTNEFYSCAQHCVHVSRRVEEAMGSDAVGREFALAGLLHDAPEAYISDIVRPLKVDLAAYKSAEVKIMRVVAERFCARAYPVPRIVDQVDRRMLLTEARDLLNEPCWLWERAREWGFGPYGDWKVEPWSPKSAEASFLLRFGELSRAPEEMVAN